MYNVPSTAVLFAAAAESVGTVVLFPSYVPRDNALFWVFLYALGVNAAAFTIWNAFIYPFYFSPLRKLPKVKGGIFPFNHGLSPFAQPRGSIFLRWSKEVPNDGLIRFHGFANRDMLFVTSPAVLKEILVTKSYDFEKPPPLRNFLRYLLGDGLIIVEGDDHKFLRKNLMPAFSFRHIKDLYPIFWDKAVQLALGLDEQLKGNPRFMPENDSRQPRGVIEVNHWANQVTMDIIGMAAMGRDFKSLNRIGDEDPLIVNYEELLEPTIEKQIYFAANIVGPAKLIRTLPWKLNERMRVVSSNLARICTELVHERKQAIKGESNMSKDILGLCLESNNFSDKQLVDQLLTFLAAGHETTSSTFTWVAYLLAKNPEVQSALREEVRASIPSPDQSPPEDQAGLFESLPLLNGVCNETLRLYPTVPITLRMPKTDTALADVVIPKGTQIFLCPWSTNRDPDLWGANAETFVPERWIDTDPDTGKRRPNNSGNAPSNYAALTFLHGPRSCIGQEFAKAELRCIVATFAGRFNIELPDPNKEIFPAGAITTKPGDGMHLRLTRIDGW